MGTSTDGQICYGIKLKEEGEFPWEEWDDDIEGWWLYAICGYKNPIELCDSHGNYIDGREPTEEEANLYYDTKLAFQEKHPLPVELVRHCSREYPMYILAALDTLIYARRGYPVAFKPTALSVGMGKATILIGFCREHNIEFEGEPQWWLSSYWG